MNKIVLYPADGLTKGVSAYESLSIEIDGVPGCVFYIVREEDSDVWQGRINSPEGVKESPHEGFVFGDYLLETRVGIHGLSLTGIPGYERLEVSNDYHWCFDAAGGVHFAKKGATNDAKNY